MKFTELQLKPEILKALKRKGYEDLTPIQEQTFPHVLAGRDLIALAQTGSGKTAACAIPVLQAVDPSDNNVQALIIVPTRELALQYVDEIADIAKGSGISAFAVYGGFSMEIQLGKLNHGVQVLVATPGRLIDLLYNSPLRLADVKHFVLDEADEMLNQGFETDIEFVFSCLIHEHRTMLFSATMPNEIKKLSQKYLTDPVLVELITDQKSPDSLNHCFQAIKSHKRFESLEELLKKDSPKQAIVFCSSRRTCEKVYDHLKKDFDSVEQIHGGLDQNRRTSLFRRFKRLDIRFLVATDIASRGLDFSHVTHVVNYDFPNNPEAYTHRTGRTARMGREGKAITFYTNGELRKLKAVIRGNRIKPIWLGSEPDMNKLSGKQSAGGRPSGPRSSGPGGKRKNFRRRKPKPKAD